MQQIDVQAIGFVGQIGRNPDRKPFGMRRARGAVGMQAGQLAFALNDFCIGVEDFGKFAMQADADMRGLVGIFLHQSLRASA